MSARPLAFLAAMLLSRPAWSQFDFMEKCQAGDSQACINAAGMAGAKNDKEAALRLYDRGCTLGNTTACQIFIGELGDDEAGRKKALPYKERLCAKRDSVGCGMVADAYFLGWGTRRDVAKAKSYKAKEDALNKTAKPSAASCSTDQECGLAGRDAVYRDDWEAAARAITRSCDLDKGHSWCLNAMYLLYSPRRADLLVVATLYQRACDASLPQGCHLLASLLASGRVPKDAARLAAAQARATEGEKKQAQEKDALAQQMRDSEAQMKRYAEERAQRKAEEEALEQQRAAEAADLKRRLQPFLDRQDEVREEAERQRRRRHDGDRVNGPPGEWDDLRSSRADEIRALISDLDPVMR